MHLLKAIHSYTLMISSLLLMIWFRLFKPFLGSDAKECQRGGSLFCSDRSRRSAVDRAELALKLDQDGRLALIVCVDSSGESDGDGKSDAESDCDSEAEESMDVDEDNDDGKRRGDIVAEKNKKEKENLVSRIFFK